MKSRTLVSFLLLAALSISFFSIPKANSQTAATATTMTIPQMPLGQCSYISLPFMGQKGTQITGTFGSDAIVSFYVLSPENFIDIQNPLCRLPGSARPLYSQEYSVGHDTPYRTLTFPANGTYYFVFVYHNGGLTTLAKGYATVELSYPASLTILRSETSSTNGSSEVIATTVLSNMTVLGATGAVSQNTTPLLTSSPFGLNDVVGIVVAIGLVTSVVVFMKRRSLISTKQRAPKKETGFVLPQPAIGIPRQIISTGYAEFDVLLAGGLPTGRSILIESPPCDERDLLLRKIIESGLSIGGSIFFLSRDVGRTQDFASIYRRNFYAFTPQTDKITANIGNIYKISGVQYLVDLNISLTKAIEPILEGKSIKIMIVDFLSDILLEHKALTTRKWLDEFIARHKAEQFTILATLNPLITNKQETQTIVDLFDGIIEIYEKELRERARRFLIVKKMYGVKYVETELLLDKDKLF